MMPRHALMASVGDTRRIARDHRYGVVMRALFIFARQYFPSIAAADAVMSAMTRPAVSTAPTRPTP
jgi:hypothetical protein